MKITRRGLPFAAWLLGGGIAAGLMAQPATAQTFKGEILIGGISLGRLGTAHYRNLIGSVMQDDQLFSGSLADNIAFFDPQPEFERIEACAKLAAIHDDILAMPMGHQTPAGEKVVARSRGGGGGFGATDGEKGFRRLTQAEMDKGKLGRMSQEEQIKV